MKLLALVFLMFMVFPSWGQTYYKKLYHFELGQSRKELHTKLGKPFQREKFEDGYEFEAFLLNPVKKTHVIFEYAKGNLNKVWSIQITGPETEDSFSFNGVKFGTTKEELIKIYGDPIEVVNIGEFGERWEFNSNFSFEIKDSKVTSVKIRKE